MGGALAVTCNSLDSREGLYGGLNIMTEEIRFIASLPPIQSAINLGGAEGDSSRIKLDVPGTEVAAVVKLLLLRGKAFKVIIEPLD